MKTCKPKGSLPSGSVQSKVEGSRFFERISNLRSEAFDSGGRCQQPREKLGNLVLGVDLVGCP
jgi:hypothetical protein